MLTWWLNDRANCICPGCECPFTPSSEFVCRANNGPSVFPSEMAAPIVQAAGGSMTGSGIIPLDKSVVPVGRMGDEVDMAGQILYLTSRAGAYLNGNTIVVDGGRLGTFPSVGY